MYLISDELLKLGDEGYGIFISKDAMHRDGILAFNQCANVFLKGEVSFLPRKFFTLCADRDLTDNVYVSNFNKNIDSTVKRIVRKYHPHKEYIFMSTLSNNL